MSKCLITKLKEVCSNTNLSYLGCLTIDFPKLDKPSSDKQKFIILPIGLDVKMLEGNITDSGLSNNLGVQGKTSGLEQYVSNGSKLLVSSKYNLEQIISSSLAMDIGELAYSKALKILQTTSDGVHGDISSLKNTALNNLKLSSSKIYGDVSSLADKTFGEFKIENSDSVYGDISFLKKSTSLLSLAINNCDRIVGDVAIPSDNLLDVQVNGMNHLYGDLSKLGKNVYFFANNNGNSKFTWKGTRTSDAKIIAFQGAVNFGDDVDNVLNSLKDCTATSESAAWLKTISIKGTRTEASDTALSVLSNKGYTIYVDPA